MSNVNNQYKELINEAIHGHFHDKTELEMILKDWLYGVCDQLDEYEAKAKSFDAYHGTIQSHLHLKGVPEFSNPATEVLSELIDIHDDYENKEDK